MRVVLFEPEIPPNTGNVARLCAGFGVELHLVGRLGFSLEDRYLRRAGLDYWPHVRLFVWQDWAAFAARPGRSRLERWILTTAKRKATPLQDFAFRPEDALIFGPETRGLPEGLFAASPWRVRIPVRAMEEGGVRSLNLSTAAGIVLFTALTASGLIAPGQARP
ncbi:tRNA (cytidine(34)-2'-O)-methyltransferase [Desulfovibrio sp.]|uniref:tRNA (cytidine(34)-2'-O)-methyltransferase n=1 Tax=Desulfovibrio sp. TaxID=885 RepID=UPI0023C6D946|nr:tRNA (cytidine(34)-2'-O)-methyltransferase [Desulfovibrio sp.]MDE7240307.1 tRNA (cytidine(34)-2'-O)-methyltransferase [Desulfovibrio sp.]